MFHGAVIDGSGSRQDFRRFSATPAPVTLLFTWLPALRSLGCRRYVHLAAGATFTWLPALRSLGCRRYVHLAAGATFTWLPALRSLGCRRYVHLAAGATFTWLPALRSLGCRRYVHLAAGAAGVSLLSPLGLGGDFSLMSRIVFTMSIN